MKSTKTAIRLASSPELLRPSHVEAAGSLEAFESVRPLMAALSPDQLACINVDIPSLITAVRGRLPAIMQYRDQVAEKLADFDITSFDHLGRYTRALGHAHSLYLGAAPTAENVVALSQRVTATRNVLFADAQSLVAHKLIDSKKLESFKALSGYRALAFDVLGLVNVMREVWPTIEGNTATTKASLDEAEKLADRLLDAVGERGKTKPEAADATQQRLRAYTVFVRAYDQVRRAITYLRWAENDLEAIAPSLYAGRGGPRRRTSTKPPVVATDPTPIGEPADDSPNLPSGGRSSIHDR